MASPATPLLGKSTCINRSRFTLTSASLAQLVSAKSPVLMQVQVPQAQADQRAALAGAQAGGICYRVWSKSSHIKHVSLLPPAIAWQDPMAAVLHTLLFSQGRITASDLQLLDPLKPAQFASACQALHNLQLADFDQQAGCVELIDRQTAEAAVRLPVQPRLACMIVRCGKLC